MTSVTPALPIATKQVYTIQVMLLNKYIWITILIPLTIGIIRYHHFGKGIKFFFWFVVTGTITEISNYTSIYFLHLKNTMPIGHLYITVSFFFVAVFYLHELKGFIRKQILIPVIALFELFSIINMFLIQSPYSFPSISGASGALILIIASILLFSKIMIEGKIKKLAEEPIIWINSAVLIYYSSNFFYYILFNVILGFSRDFSVSTTTIFSLIYGVFNLIIAVGFWKSKQKRRELLR